MKSEEIRKRFLNFFEKRGHKIIPSASLVPENDPSVLFNTAGMQPLVPYLLGEPHPLGTRLADVQKCVRTIDIDDVGDATHATFFEMLGNWSLGDYFKKEAIAWSYELLTSKEEGFGLDPKRLYVSVFAGDETSPRDEESAKVWLEAGVPEKRIYYLGADKNWWQSGENGPCGPDSEMYYDVTPRGLGDLTREQFVEADNKREIVEIWNDVFMEFLKKDGKVVGKLPKKNVDTGAGLERLSVVIQNKDNIYDTDLFGPIMAEARKLSDELRSQRIIADHFRTAVFMISDGVIPSNTDRGYILRRLLRRAMMHATGNNIGAERVSTLVDSIADKYSVIYENVGSKKEEIKNEIVSELVERFSKTLERGIREFDKLSGKDISGFDAFTLFSSYGFPFEITEELAKKKGINVDRKGFESEFAKHQELSRKGAEHKFKGGLSDTSDKVVQYHTATHLLHQALRDILGSHVEQKGSNITAERLRFDFAHSAKMTPEEIKKAEGIVNEKIAAAIPMNRVVLSKDEAEKTGALHFFGEKYGDQVSIYFVGDDIKTAYSKEFCGGPHVKNTNELKGTFKIKKEEAVAAGIRRIKAVLE
ncbi:MAG: alanine--tRNA ligase [Candidatus Taylorbacteria bacterium]|nr:alanine--tRNA ligase [Candidatus Taylorbacteria bacterium]